MKKRVFAIVPTVILCILLFYLIKTSQSPKSPYQNLTPVSGFSIQAVQAQYTIDTKQISLCITNHSDNSPELYLPYLEQNINETWVIVKKSPHIRDTDNLLYIPSGETMNVDFFLTDYDQLSVRFLYKGIIIKHNKTEPTYTKTSLFLCEKRRFFMARTEKGVVPIIYFEKGKGGKYFKLAGPCGLAFFHFTKRRFC